MVGKQRKPDVICKAVTFLHVSSEGDVYDIEGEFVYESDDPFGVTLICLDAESRVRWTFSRDLLIDGVFEPSGEGDVQIWPSIDADEVAVTHINLISPEGEYLLEIDSREVVHFTTEMLSLIPRNTETDYLDIDAELKTLLSL